MKKLISAVLVCLLLVLQAFPVYAQTSTFSNWVVDAKKASPSDWNSFTPFDWDAYESEFGIFPFSGDLPSVSNTVKRTSVRAVLAYYDMSNKVQSKSVYLSADGYFSFSRPSNYVKPAYLAFYMLPGALPTPGVYDFSFRFASNTGGFEYSSAYLFSRKSTVNASDQDARQYLSGASFRQFSGDFYINSVVDIGSGISWLESTVNLPSSGFGFPFGGYASIRFSRSSSPPDYTTAGGSQTSEDIQQDISDSAGQIVNNTEAINGTLKELIQHISNQLAALWDQMYNFMHVPLVNNDNARTQRIIDRLDEGFDINVEVLDRNFHDLMANDDKNTNTVVNGYDNSGINSDKNRLDTAMGNYTDVENSVLDSVNSALENFEFSGSMDSYLTCIGTVSGFMQNLYDSSGALKDAIVIGFLLSIASIVIGLYRFKEG